MPLSVIRLNKHLSYPNASLEFKPISACAAGHFHEAESRYEPIIAGAAGDIVLGPDRRVCARRMDSACCHSNRSHHFRPHPREFRRFPPAVTSSAMLPLHVSCRFLHRPRTTLLAVSGPDDVCPGGADNYIVPDDAVTFSIEYQLILLERMGKVGHGSGTSDQCAYLDQAMNQAKLANLDSSSPRTQGCRFPTLRRSCPCHHQRLPDRFPSSKFRHTVRRTSRERVVAGPAAKACRCRGRRSGCRFRSAR